MFSAFCGIAIYLISKELVKTACTFTQLQQTSQDSHVLCETLIMINVLIETNGLLYVLIVITLFISIFGMAMHTINAMF
jgi:hypothetical protein